MVASFQDPSASAVTRAEGSVMFLSVSIGEKMSHWSTPRSSLNSSDITFTPLDSLTRTIPVATGKMKYNI